MQVWWPKDERADETKEGLGRQEWKPRPLSAFPHFPNVGTINEFQVLLTSITCLLSYTIQGEGICLTLPQPRIRASSNQQMTRKAPIPLLGPWL